MHTYIYIYKFVFSNYSRSISKKRDTPTDFTNTFRCIFEAAFQRNSRWMIRRIAVYAMRFSARKGRREREEWEGFRVFSNEITHRLFRGILWEQGISIYLPILSNLKYFILSLFLSFSEIHANLNSILLVKSFTNI